MKNLNSILKTFQKTIAKLDALAESNESIVAVNTKAIDALQQCNLDLIAEQQAAKNAADKIRALIAE